MGTGTRSVPITDDVVIAEGGGRVAMRGLERRLAELERTLGADKITLWMADGTTRMVSSRRLLAMVGETGRGPIKDDTRAVLDSVSDDCMASGNGRLIECIKALAAGEAQVAELAALDASE
jgi:hypothetical protein